MTKAHCGCCLSWAIECFRCWQDANSHANANLGLIEQCLAWRRVVCVWPWGHLLGHNFLCRSWGCEGWVLGNMKGWWRVRWAGDDSLLMQDPEAAGGYLRPRGGGWGGPTSSPFFPPSPPGRSWGDLGWGVKVGGGPASSCLQQHSRQSHLLSLVGGVSCLWLSMSTRKVGRSFRNLWTLLIFSRLTASSSTISNPVVPFSCWASQSF